jgi:hypothetical protein
MLRRSIVAALIGAVAVPTGVEAVNLAQRGVGQVLLFPYYTVNAGNQTLISVVNKTDAGKAIKVRFREGRNSREVVDFNLYLSPFDVWTAALFSFSDTGPDNPANLITFDNSCTVPRIKGNTRLPILANGSRYAPFFNYVYSGAFNDAGPNTLDRTREGHFEMIEMGELVDRERASLTAITHGSNGIPGNCTQIERAWLLMGLAPAIDTYWTTNALVDIDPPQGGLFGSAAIVDALAGTMMAYDAEAIDAFSDIAQHTDPGSLEPSLQSARSNADTAVAHVFHNGALVTSSYPRLQAVDAVSALFVQDSILNEFVTSASVGGASEWVVTFPTKQFYTDQEIVGSFEALEPFTRLFPIVSSSSNNGVAAVDVKFSKFDREAFEFTPEAPCADPLSPTCVPFGTQPPTPPDPFPLQLLWSSNVIAFDQANAVVEGTAILGSRLVASATPAIHGVTAGWAGMNLYSATPEPGAQMDRHKMRPDQSGGRWYGLPTMGFWAVSYTNGQLTPGVLSNYAALSMHRGSNRYEPLP